MGKRQRRRERERINSLLRSQELTREMTEKGLGVPLADYQWAWVEAMWNQMNDYQKYGFLTGLTPRQYHSCSEFYAKRAELETFFQGFTSVEGLIDEWDPELWKEANAGPR